MLPLSQGRETEYCGEAELFEEMGYTGMSIALARMDKG
jgi:hypothetical protein